MSDKLKELISTINFNEPYNIQGHRQIYDHVETLASSDASSTIPVPSSLVFYGARNILSPSFIIGQIPDLLNLVTVIETFRRFAVLKSDEALEWQQYYEHEKTCGRAEDVRLLAANEVRAMRRFLDKKDAQRREYIVLVRCLIHLYTHYLWTAPESCLLAKRLNDFFPGSFNGVDMPSDLLFHVDLTEEEKAYFVRLKMECQEWMSLVSDWETKREGTCRDEGLSKEDMDASFENDFCVTFPQPYEPSEMARNVEIYMKKVEDMMRKLEQWFPPSSGT
ncbi:hypothetical protein EV363DRAFT_1347086 [Boletus edulis]|nr:hypothetical protein EV363DRAFT_1347086 [Boletus edulis]